MSLMKHQLKYFPFSATLYIPLPVHSPHVPDILVVLTGTMYSLLSQLDTRFTVLFYFAYLGIVFSYNIL